LTARAHVGALQQLAHINLQMIDFRTFGMIHTPMTTVTKDDDQDQ
jgi:hypothetical protein